MYYAARRNDYFDNLFNDMFRSPFFLGNNYVPGVRSMKTNIMENEKDFVLDLEMPGFEKEDIKAELKNGYLTVSAKKDANNEEKDDAGKFIRRERFEGTFQRSFYVGEKLKEEDIRGAYKNGVLTLVIPKEVKAEAEQPKLITID